MAQSTHSPVRALESESGAIVYRSVSVLAIAGLIVAIFYGLLMVAAGVSAFFSGAPLLLDGWTLVFPLSGAGLSAAGWWQVRRSEGTRVGLGLARWGLILSLLFGLGYWAYYLPYEFALRRDAEQFTEKWFEKLREGDLNSAFLFTLPPDKREGIRPNDPEDMRRFQMPGEGGASALDAFESNRLVRFVQQGGATSEIRPLGVRGWSYERGSYEVIQNYRISTMEGQFDFLLGVRSMPMRGAKRGGRQWFITKMDYAGTGQASELGTTLGLWGTQSGDFARKWFEKLGSGDAEGAFWDTVDPAERQRKQPEHVQRLPPLAAESVGLAPLAVGPGGIVAGCTVLAWMQWDEQRDLPDGYRQYRAGGLLREQNFDVADPKLRAELLAAIENVFRHPGTYRLSLMSPTQVARWERVGDRVRFTSKYQTPVAELKARLADVRVFRYELAVTVESDPGPISAGRRPSWRIVQVDVLAGGDMAKERQGMLPQAPAGGTPFQRQ